MTVVGLAERFGCLPSQVLEEDADLLAMVELADLARPREELVVGG